MLKKSYIALSISALLLGGTMAPAVAVHADGGQAAVSEPLATVDTSENIQVSLKDVYELQADEYKTISFTLKIRNNRPIDVQFIDYWVKVMSSTGVDYTVNLLPQEKEKNTIPAQTTQTFSFYAKVGQDVALQDLEFHFIKWDFGSGNFEEQLGVMKVPDDYVMEVPAGESKAIQIAKAPVNTSVKKFSLSRNDKYIFPYVTVEMQNVGSASVKLPDMQYYMMTDSGILYPLQASGVTKDAVMDPFAVKEGTLTASIPVAVAQSNWKLVVAQNIQVDSKTITLPMGIFRIPSTEANEVSVGTEYEFSTVDGTYTAKLNSVMRYPWEDQDILAANLTIGNPSSESLPLPQFGGYFKLDDNVKLEAKAIVMDEVIGLPKGTSANVQIVAKLPYTYTFTDLKLFLQEQIKPESNGEDAQTAAKTNDLLQFVHHSDLMNIPTAMLGEKYAYGSIGRSSALTVRSVLTFDDQVEDLFVAQLLVENKEKRFADISKLIAYFETWDGTMFPATLSEIKDKVKPEGAALFEVSTTLPHGYNTSGMRLLVGEAVKDGALAKDKENDGYVNPVYLTLPEEHKEPAAQLTEIDMFPYTFSLSRIGTYFDDFMNDKLALEFDYELKKNSLTVSNTENHKVILEIQDKDSDVKVEKEYILDKDLKIGKDHMKEQLTVKDLKISLENIQKYKFNVYYDLGTGHRKLMASKELSWFVYND